jgi:hypothetical protein
LSKKKRRNNKKKLKSMLWLESLLPPRRSMTTSFMCSVSKFVVRSASESSIAPALTTIGTVRGLETSEW